MRDMLDDFLQVSEEEIQNAILMLLEKACTLAEGAGAASLAGALQIKRASAGQEGGGCNQRRQPGNAPAKVSVDGGFKESARPPSRKAKAKDRKGVAGIRLTRLGPAIEATGSPGKSLSQRPIPYVTLAAIVPANNMRPPPHSGFFPVMIPSRTPIPTVATAHGYREH